VLSESEFAAAAAAGWEPIIEYIESRNLSLTGVCFSRGSSPFRGVSWNKVNKKWLATININGKGVHVYLGDIEEEAALAYDSGNHYVHGHDPT
jgi:hypothetical protein